MKLTSLLKQLLLASCLAGLGAQASAAGDQGLGELRRLVDGGQFEAAYKLAATQTGLLGSPHYDFLLGLAAVNSGHVAQGVLALERHLAVVPANDRARLELAKGYYELGDYFRARQEFEFVLRYSPPKDVQDNVQKYLDAMQTREVITSRASSRSYIEMGLGTDSNVNAGTYNNQVVYNNQVGQINPEAKGVESSFWQISAGTQWLRRVDTSLAVFAGLDLDVKANPAATAYDTTSVGGYTGLSVLKNSGLYRLTLSEGQLRVNGEKYRNTLSLTGEGQFSLGQGYTATSLAQYSEMANAPANANHDARMLTLGGGLQRTYQTAWRPTVGVQVTYGQEANLARRKDFSRNILTSRLTVSASPTERVSVSAGLTKQDSLYEQETPGTGIVREDAMWSLDLGANYLWDRHWLIRADLQYIDSSSNDDSYPYRRTLVGLRSRYLF